MMSESLSWFPLKSQRVSENVTPVTIARDQEGLGRAITIEARIRAETGVTIGDERGIGAIPRARRRPIPEIEILYSTDLALLSFDGYQ